MDKLEELAKWIAIDHGETRLEAPKYLEEAQELADYLYLIGYRIELKPDGAISNTQIGRGVISNASTTKVTHNTSDESSLLNDEWIEDWLLNRMGPGNAFEKFNRQFCRNLIDDASVLIRADERAKNYQWFIGWLEKNIEPTSKEVSTMPDFYLRGHKIAALQKGEMP